MPWPRSDKSNVRGRASVMGMDLMLVMLVIVCNNIGVYICVAVIMGFCSVEVRKYHSGGPSRVVWGEVVLL